MDTNRDHTEHYEIDRPHYESQKHFAEIIIAVLCGIIAIVYAPSLETLYSKLLTTLGFDLIIHFRARYDIFPSGIIVMLIAGSIVAARTIYRASFYRIIGFISKRRAAQTIISYIIYSFLLFIYIVGGYISFGKSGVTVDLTYNVSFVIICLFVLFLVTWLFYMLREKIDGKVRLIGGFSIPFRFILIPLILILLPSPTLVGLGLNGVVGAPGKVTRDDFVIVIADYYSEEGYTGGADKTLPGELGKALEKL